MTTRHFASMWKKIREIPEFARFRYSLTFEHGLYSCRGFDSKGLHFARSFRSLRRADSFLRAMRRADASVCRY